MNKPLREDGEQKASPREFAAVPILSLFSADHAALWHAARFLGGYEASRLVDRCVDVLERERAITNTVRVMLDQLLTLLSMTGRSDQNGPYLAHFVVVDPEDPVVEEIAQLRDQLATAIASSASRLSWAQRQADASTAT